MVYNALTGVFQSIPNKIFFDIIGGCMVRQKLSEWGKSGAGMEENAGSKRILLILLNVNGIRWEVNHKT